MLTEATVKAIQDIMRKDAGVDGDAQRLSQLTWMLFLKILDDRENEYESTRPRYTSPLPRGLRWRDWTAGPSAPSGDDLIPFVNNRLFPRLRTLNNSDTAPLHDVVRQVFSDTHNYMKSGLLMRQVIERINESIDFSSPDERRSFGDVYEQLLRDLQSAGNAGEYYTPRALTEFMVQSTGPRLGETVLDPACGTGGFLTSTIEYVRRKEVSTSADENRLQMNIRGVEKKPLPYLLCATNLLLHGIEIPFGLTRDNSLQRPLKDYTNRDRADVILTNPPFGGMEEEGIENNFPEPYRTRETADLFLVLIIHLLKPGGRAAMVVPDGTLFGGGVKARIKEHLLSSCDLHTIVRLPNGVFSPYTNIRTNLLFFSKPGPTRSIWYYEHEYPAGQRTYSKTKPITPQEFAAEQTWWHHRQERKNAWRIDAKEVAAAGYNLDIRPVRTTEQGTEDPAELQATYDALSTEITELRDRLKKELERALRRRGNAN